MNIVEAFRESKDGRIRLMSWSGNGCWIKWKSLPERGYSHWVDNVGKPFSILEGYMFSDDWEPYVEPVPETPEQTMRRVAREEIGKAVIDYTGIDGKWIRDRLVRIVPGDSDE